MSGRVMSIRRRVSLSTGRRVVHRSVWTAALDARYRLAGRMKRFKRIAQWAKGIRATANDLGMTTAEYAVGTVAAVAFAAVLYKIVRSPAVSSALTSIITSALHAI
jgi:hypothetical protein